MALTPEQLMAIAGACGTGVGALLMHLNHSRDGNGGGRLSERLTDAMKLEMRRGLDDLRKEVVQELRYQGDQVRDDLRTAMTTHLATIERQLGRQ